MASSGSNQQPAAKRPRYSAKSVKMRADKTKEGALAPLQVAVHSWGQTASVYFPGHTRSTPMWQLQVMHDAHNGLGFMMNSSLREALPKFRGGAATTLESMERLHGIKYTNAGGPGDRFDRDGAGFQHWRIALYVAGPTCDAGLELLGLVVERKIEIGHLVLPPEMQVIGREVEFPHGPLPAGWRYVQTLDVPTPFAALPPKSRRHLWMQVELPQESAAAAAAGQQPAEEEDAATTESWVVMFYGGVYDYRDRFEALNIEGGQIEEDSDTKNFVRMLTADLGNESKKLLSAVLGDAVFCHAPVALLNATGADDDKLVAWLTEQKSVHLQMEAVE